MLTEDEFTWLSSILFKMKCAAIKDKIGLKETQNLTHSLITRGYINPAGFLTPKALEDLDAYADGREKEEK